MNTDMSSAGGGGENPGPRLRRRPAVVVATAAVLLAGGAGTYWASAGGGDQAGTGDPPPLVLDAPAAPPETGPRGDAAGIAPGEPAGPVHYRAEGELPRGPKAAAVHRPSGQVQRGDVAALAGALDVAGEPEKKDGRWTVTAAGERSPVLTVDGSDGVWTFLRPGPSDAGPPTTEQQAAGAVRPALKALGMNGAEVDASRTASSLREVAAAPEVAGLPTRDRDSTFSVGPDGDVVRGRGHLKQLARGATYPVLSASETLKRLNERGRSEPAGRTGRDGRTARVQDAVFGLVTHYSQGEPVLVPSWIYTVERSGGRPVTQPAVAPPHLQVPHGPARSPEATGQTATSYRADGRTLMITFWAGVCDDYTASADESRESVEIRVRAEKPDAERVCVKMAKRQTVEVALNEPLGDRRVVDGRTGKALPQGE